MGREAGSSSQSFKAPAKRSRPSSSSTGESLLSRIVRSAGELLGLHKPRFVYHQDDKEQRSELIRELWKGDYREAVGSLSTENQHLTSLFGEQTLRDDSGASETRVHYTPQSSWPRFEGLMNVLFRSRSSHLVPLFVAALSVRALHYRTPRHFWDSLVHFCRAIMSRSWTEKLVDEAVEQDPGPPYETAAGISGAVFDNFTLQVAYGSYATVDSSGQRFDMTNWASVLLPARAVPASFSIDRMLGAGGIFRTDRRMLDFLDLFSPGGHAIVTNQEERWRQFLAAAEAKTMLDKPAYASPFPPTRYVYHPPIWDRMQSSYEDVNFELDLMRTSIYHRYSDALLLGGDGLSYMRLIHRLAQDPRRYLETKPLVIPQLGEHPHGTYHVLHGDWRIWWPLLEKFAHVVGNHQVRADPTISEFNKHEHFLRICARACAEYVAEISATGSDYRVVPQFLRDARRNLSFAYVCYFLYLAAFKYLQMRNAVRRNESATLDLVWRENLASARTSMANKTNYAPMSVVRVYWGWALVEPLQTVYHNLRTLRQVLTHVGWDWPIENLNLLIREGVTSNITRELIEKFIKRINFTGLVNRALDAIFRDQRKQEEATDKDVDNDVQLIKDFLHTHIGTTYAAATAASDANSMGLDLSTWGGARHARREAPWAQMEREMADVDDFVRDVVTRLCPWHHWQP
jgi:hypothetical protein